MTDLRSVQSAHISGHSAVGPYQVERAVRPTDNRVTYVVLDEDLMPMPEARDFALYLDGSNHAVNTQKTYIPRVARFLNWCLAEGVDWRTVTMRQMVLFKRTVEITPTRSGRPPSGKTVNITLTAVLEFLRFCARMGAIASEVVARFVETRHLVYTPTGFDPGENNQNRTIRARPLKATEEHRPPEALSDVEVDAILRAARNCRDYFLLHLLLDTGIRIGEALGLHRSDLHFLPDSKVLGCAIAGPHLHVRRRINENDAYAKSVFPRHVPVTDSLVESYREYQAERERLAPRADTDFVLLNLYDRAAPGGAMRYRNAKRCFDRIAKDSGVVVRPHMLRHTAGTNWAESGMTTDLVQELLGHASMASTSIYLHPSHDVMRRAIDQLPERGGIR